MKKIIYILLILLTLSACKIGKQYTRPELDMPSAYDADADTSSIRNLPWQSLYKDTVLQNLIEVALENNKDMKIAAAKIKEMAYNKRISFADYFPQIGANVAADREMTNYSGEKKVFNPEVDAKLTFAWELDFWGKLRWTNETDVATYMGTIEAQHALQLTLVSEVAANYYELLALDRELMIVNQTLSARKEGVRLAKLRYKGGLTSETPVNQAEVELARTETLIPGIKHDIELKESNLLMLLGQYEGKIPRGIWLSNQELPPTLPAGLPSSLLERRPDIRQAEQQLRVTNASVGVAYTSMFPTISLTGNAGFESDQLGGFLKSPTWAIGANLLSPVFNMGKNRAKYKAAQARYEQEVYTYQKAVLTAFQDVNTSVQYVRKTKEVRTSYEQLNKSTETYARLAYLQYINGVTSYLDVLDAQRELFDAQISLNNAQRDELLAIVYLYKALGGDF